MTPLAPSITIMVTVSLQIKIMLVNLQSYGRATFLLVVWLGFDVVAKLISPLGFEYKLGYF